MIDFDEIRSKILDGCMPSLEEAVFLLGLEGAQVFDLFMLANRITRRHFGDLIDTCSILNAKSGLCDQNCSFCAQSTHHNTGIKPYPLMGEDEVLSVAEQMEESGSNRFSIVTSGLSLNQDEFERILHTIRRLRDETNLSICTSIGSLNQKRALMLKSAGVTCIHHNLETSKRFFPRVCTTHTYEDWERTLGIAKDIGFEVCSGGIIGLGEKLIDRVELALALKDLDVDSVPINILTPIPGTPLEDTITPSPLEVLKTIAVYRILLPSKHIRLAGGREVNLRSLQSLALISGADGLMLGNYLTTSGNTPEEDLEMISDLGLRVKDHV